VQSNLKMFQYFLREEVNRVFSKIIQAYLYFSLSDKIEISNNVGNTVTKLEF
jgi:hypothetical protein